MSNTKPEIQKNKPSDVEFADIGRRMFSWIIDMVLIIVLYLILQIFFLRRIIFRWGLFWFVILSWIFQYLIGLLYFWILESINGKTLGKLFVGIRTVDEDTFEVSSYIKNLKNCILKCFWHITILIDLVIGAIKISNDPQNRIRIMQKVSHTVVIKTTTK